MGASHGTLKQRVYHEIKEFLVIALYLWVILGLFTLHKAIILGEQHIALVYKGLALINALALAKIMLVARALHLGDRANHGPLIYPTLVKSALFAVVLASFQILEEAAIGLYRGKSFHESIEVGGGNWKGILSVTLITCVALIPFFGFTELQRVLGEGKLEQIFFGRRGRKESAGHEG